MNLFKNLKKDVIAGANGTLDYVFKKGKNIEQNSQDKGSVNERRIKN